MYLYIAIYRLINPHKIIYVLHIFKNVLSPMVRTVSIRAMNTVLTRQVIDSTETVFLMTNMVNSVINNCIYLAILKMIVFSFLQIACRMFRSKLHQLVHFGFLPSLFHFSSILYPFSPYLLLDGMIWFS